MFPFHNLNTIRSLGDDVHRLPKTLHPLDHGERAHLIEIGSPGVLIAAGHLGTYRELLGLLGCADLPADRVRHHLRALAATFDATAEVARTPFFFRNDIAPGARAVAIDGSQALVDAGDHREAMFWIIATFTRCHTILATDAPALHKTLAPDFLAAVADLGVTSPQDLRARAGEVTRYLPRLWRTAEDVLARNPGISG